ncbi:hypothetical protein ACOWPH_19105 [Anabaena sp. PCC 7938]|uniref:Uncharacterized protein n=1 Tax=Anabaena cylindrica (strain ATCC 27899 / PCC 7122) TaxID=272123 RepID=K9ZM95_ANACC|nr:hypothetical protein [Anabaena sp. CCAP 1446/1C]AFZ60353.1 hypothetical protein Anacy_5013 [Anabaena cylindrica PCC 7122]MBY5284855.1 hypothetical protein [Anabaena sp. CCAP 1446/1C]MCM2404512.1 hypothetical protein [Anabaena sp. CCAP 1446/1C]BAY02576.1 hypothetical protein NIES19_18210 [Anabaena cylindrica PCC 7122]
MGNDLVSPVSSPSKFQHIENKVAKRPLFQVEPNPKAEKQESAKLASLSTLSINCQLLTLTI